MGKRQVCAVCGQGGYWVGFDGASGEDRCVNHIGTHADTVSPDCRDGKCAACIGDAWDETKDELTVCQHACHGAEKGE